MHVPRTRHATPRPNANYADKLVITGRDDACGRQRRRRACGNLQVVRTKQGGYGTHKPMSAEEVQECKDAT